MTAKKMAKQYYPLLWRKARIEALVAAGKLSREDADEVINGVTADNRKDGTYEQ